MSNPSQAHIYFSSSPNSRSLLLRPTFRPHASLYLIPNRLHNLSIPPPSLGEKMGVPLLHLHSRDPSPPPFDGSGNIFPSPPDIDTHNVSEQLGGVLPLVSPKLPGLPRREDGYDAVPVVWLELFGGVD